MLSWKRFAKTPGPNGCIIVRRNGCGVWRVRELPFPNKVLARVSNRGKQIAHHLERVQLLLDLLRKHRSEPVASGNLPTAVVVRSGPCVVELETRAERDITTRPVGRAGQAPCAGVGQTRWASKVVVPLVHGCARSARLGRLVADIHGPNDG